ncbi:CBS domain-containing protein cbsx2 chloroplastic [Phtheirospermum japonicum]|uniref:CBS domain-containing protein cbsx2 chloroplastic n=1 Tax=Phtheirospermum japonicum TaxID=374723 RepID=A0A830DAI7_9LAMI|nr:CBS domain-containing protein cbsx2 chloroplastic [Phtheirospermum japonicum]
MCKKYLISTFTSPLNFNRCFLPFSTFSHAPPMDCIAVLPLSGAFSTVRGRSLPCTLTFYSRFPLAKTAVTSGCGSSGPRRRRRLSEFRRPDALRFAASDTANSVPPQEGIFTVGDFMTRREMLHVVGPTTTVDEALETLVENRITGFPVVDDDGKLVGVVSDYDLLALDSISGGAQQDTNMFPVVDSTWKTFNEIQKLLSKTNGRVVGDLMTPSPLAVRENTNLEDAVRLLLKTKYRRLPVVDGEGKLIGIITRGDIVRGALQIKQATEKM